MANAKLGDTVVLHYTGRLDDGSVFDSSEQREPLRVTLGETGLIPGFEEAVIGMEPGDSKTAKIPAESAYGPRRDDMVVEFNRGELPAQFDPSVGQQVQLRTQSGQPIPARVIDVNDDAVKLDANHPLAGEALTFDIRLVELVAEA
ncbi:MAG: peptidylprolyl isomerase [Pirellulaceae bacterium]|nr:peptidylprolyl isomerase [Planctomycetales bacterium]MCA9207091.1 peptidylprolyl isomerase [Planctomycetales bacterium]MCA9221676.1 peptidylprolyl isomerase [Planctomycetales bacterium]MCA9224145.1 peptidylprolyl isomerase [Planctomycetales bacterium]